MVKVLKVKQVEGSNTKTTVTIEFDAAEFYGDEPSIENIEDISLRFGLEFFSSVNDYFEGSTQNDTLDGR